MRSVAGSGRHPGGARWPGPGSAARETGWSVAASSPPAARSGPGSPLRSPSRPPP